MSNPFANWWQSQRLKIALLKGDTQKAVQLLQAIQKSGVKFSWLEKLFRDKLKFERSYQEYQQEKETLTGKLHDALQQLEDIKLQTKFPTSDNDFLKTDNEFIKHIYKTFNLLVHDENKIQCTGIDERIFDDFEAQLVDYLKDEFNKIPDERLSVKLQDALEDINSLKSGKDPDYGFSLTPHVYYMKYFLENVYCLYLAWFLIYESGLLSAKTNILDIAAGPATTAFGLGLFLQSTSGFFKVPQTHISYYSFEKQNAFQFRGLQFWRKYIESSKTSVNAFFRFVTEDIFNCNVKNNNIPNDFFDFIVISHCFFTDTVRRIQANNNYKKIFSTCLKEQGYVLLIIQDKKLYKAYDAYQVEDHHQEKNLVSKFLGELDLELVWYKYLTSTGSRTPFTSIEFAKFAQNKLPLQNQMSKMLQKYFAQKYKSHYALDDYIILAKKSHNGIY